MEAIERRAFMKGAGLGALAFTVGGVEVMLTPSEARAQGAPLRTLTAEQAATLDALGRIEIMKGPAESGQICSVGRRKIAKKIAKNKRCYANT